MTTAMGEGYLEALAMKSHAEYLLKRFGEILPVERVWLQAEGRGPMETVDEGRADRSWGRRQWVRCWHPEVGAWVLHSRVYHDR